MCVPPMHMWRNFNDSVCSIGTGIYNRLKRRRGQWSRRLIELYTENRRESRTTKTSVTIVYTHDGGV